MRNPVYGKNFKVLLLLAGLMLTLLFWGCRKSEEATPAARQGVIDLSGWDLGKDGPVRLDGEWEFYWGRLLTPADFNKPRAPEMTGYLAFPSPWNDFEVNGSKLGGPGYATFRLRIRPGPGKRNLCLRVFNVVSAYKLWINGNPAAESGVVGKSAAVEVPNPSILMPGFRSDGGPVELVLQVSNHQYRHSGVTSSIQIGPEGLMETGQNRQWGISLFFAGALLVMGIYHLGLFFFRRKNVSPLYFGLFCLLWMGNSLTSDSSTWVIRLFFPVVPILILDRISLVCFFLSVPMGYRFFRSLFPREFSNPALRLTEAVTAVFVLISLFASTRTLFTLLPVYYFYSILLILYCLVLLHMASKRGWDEASFILAGFLVLGVSGVNDMLYDMRMIRSVYTVDVGMFVFTLFQAVALSHRFSMAFSSVERLSTELEGKNLALEEEMEQRNRLEREIVSVSEEERRRISYNLHDGLCQQLTGARLRCSVLERKMADQGDDTEAVSQLSFLLEESVNHAYDLSRGLWPVEYDPGGVGPSLEELVRCFSESSGIPIEFRQDRACESCANEHVIQLYRIAQEAISNAVKHARPDRITVTLECRPDNTIALTVHDDGIGRGAAKRSKGGLGLGIMSHRARMIGGSIMICDAEGGGTVVICMVPCIAGINPETRGKS